MVYNEACYSETITFYLSIKIIYYYENFFTLYRGGGGGGALLAIILFSVPAQAEQCTLSGYDTEVGVGIVSDSDETTFSESGFNSVSRTSDGGGLIVGASFCLSNNPAQDVFLDVFISSLSTDSPETRTLVGIKSQGTRIGVGVTWRW